MSVVLVLILMVLVFLCAYVIYQLYVNKWDFSAILKKCNCGTQPNTTSSVREALNTCTFLETDIVAGKVYNMYNDKVSKNITFDCSECEKYVYKGPDGCARYEKDPFLNIKDRGSGKNLNMCTALGFPRKCEEIFKTKTPPQTV